MSKVNIADIEAWLNEDSDTGSEKTAGAADSYSNDESLMEKLASEFEDEQFVKLANDAWTMGEIMGEAFLKTLTEKRAFEEVDPRIAGDINESVQGETPMTAQKTEDEKPTDIVPEKNVAAPAVDKMLHQKVTSGASAGGGDQQASEGQQLSPPPGPQSGNEELTNMTDAQKKVSHFLAQKKSDSFNKEAARRALIEAIKSGDLG